MGRTNKQFSQGNKKIKCLGNCRRELVLTSHNFFKSNNPEFVKYEGFSPICKQCSRGMIFNNDNTVNLDNFKKVLKYLDKPFIRSIFEEMLIDGFTLGDYTSRLNFGQYRTMGFADSIEGENSTQSKVSNVKSDNKPDTNTTYSEEWRGQYNEVDMKYLNNYLARLQDDFNIITTNHLDYARKIAKASLAVDKAYEDMLNGVDGADRRYKDLQSVFDNLSKSAQFSEASRSSKDVGISGISQVVEKIENKQWIYEIEDFEDDKLDHLYNQFANINKSL